MREVRMPDFEDRLEQALRDQMRRETRSRRTRVAAGTVGVAAFAASVALAAGGGPGPLAPPAAEARPLPAIFYERAATPAPTEQETGIQSAQVERAKAFDLPGAPGYVVPNASGDWCLSIPDLDTDSPRVERATSCVTGSERLRDLGLSVRAGRLVVAVVPVDAKPPVRSFDGQETAVSVNEDGVAIVDDLRPAERVTVYGTNGRTQTYANRSDGKKSFTCSDGSSVAAPSEC